MLSVGNKNLNLTNRNVTCQIITEKVDTLLEVPKVRGINYFEAEKDIHNWFIRKGELKLELSDEFVSQGNFSMKITFLEGKPAEIALLYLPQAWKYYDFLDFDMHNPDRVGEECEILISNYFDNSSWYDDLPKYRQKIQFKEGTNKFSLPVKEIGRKIDLDSERKTVHFLFNPQKRYRIYIDNLRLVQKTSKSTF